MRQSNIHYKVPGTIVHTMNYGDVVVLGVVSPREVLIRFLNTGTERTTTIGQLKSGLVKDKSVPNGSVEVGDTFQSHNCGACTVIGYRSSKDVLVKFTDSGVEKSFSAAQLRARTISDKIFNVISVGDEFETKSSGLVTVVECLPKSKFLVQFESGNTKVCSRGSLTAGAVLDGSWSYSHEEAITALLSLGTNYTFHNTVFQTVKGHILVGCPEHGEFTTTFDSMFNAGGGCKQCGIARRTVAKTIPFKDVMKDVRDVHGDKYDYSNVVYKNLNTKVEIVCNEHGSFWQSLEKHKTGQQCPVCAGTARMTVDRFIDLLPDSHCKRYSYELVGEDHFLDESRKLPIICKEHGVFHQHYRNHLSGSGCRKCARFGFNVNKPGTLYVLQDAGRVKVGITNRDMGIRLKEINKPTGNFVVMKTYGYTDGTLCLAHETDILRHLRSNYRNTEGTFSGVTESFEDVDISSVISYIENLRKYGKNKNAEESIWSKQRETEACAY